MARWRTFVDVLDDILTDKRESVAEVTARRSARNMRSTVTAPLYTFTPPPLPNRFWATPGPYQRARAASSQDLDGAVQDTRSESDDRLPAEPRAARRLKPAEQSALQTLVKLGAALDVSFTARELRTAFRSLAQRYHPDRHPGANEAERTRLGQTFAELTSAYGVLTDATR